MNNSIKPIGLFDSGIGGTSIWREIHNLLPNENTLYLADSKNAPYGQKSKDEIIELSSKNTEFLLNQNCKLIVVACNTATTNAIKELRERYDVPFIGIEPAIKPAALQTRTRTIGILATKGTLNSELFHTTVAAYKNLTVIEQVGHGLVQLIEDGKLGGHEIDELLQTYLNPMIKANIDCLVLGCSHYPYLIPQIKKILPHSVKIIDSGLAVAKQTKAVLEKYGLLNTGMQKSNQIFYTNANPDVLTTIVSKEYTVLQKDF
ncbi:glutamate racemase [Flavobacterium salilacus subsp. salilacus]|uniref:glutamate racemase n=1 Tax=Flavobacterium TaxID=237 RepID=UPI001075523E|nr:MULTISPECIES: glutamate racemase [Flavobacterium]KAF2518212.1 glutamate racemase [Flavobacterium salilacus subsp. salilacus]MBE1615473.1 glutamate racemase [Flavobacterium sp. SaA2.13]